MFGTFFTMIRARKAAYELRKHGWIALNKDKIVHLFKTAAHDEGIIFGRDWCSATSPHSNREWRMIQAAFPLDLTLEQIMSIVSKVWEEENFASSDSMSTQPEPMPPAISKKISKIQEDYPSPPANDNGPSEE